MTDNPYPPPAPLVLADMCAMQAWSDHIDDHSRKLLEWAADMLRIVVRNNQQLSHDKERLEAVEAHLLQIAYGQKGGAA